MHKKHNFVIELLEEKKLSAFHMCCNEFLIRSPEKSKWEIGYLRLCLSCFITFTCARLHIGILLPFFFHLSSWDRWRSILAAPHLLSERGFFFFFLLTFLLTQGRLFVVWPLFRVDVVARHAPAHGFAFLSSFPAVFKMHTLFPPHSSSAFWDWNPFLRGLK